MQTITGGYLGVYEITDGCAMQSIKQFYIGPRPVIGEQTRLLSPVLDHSIAADEAPASSACRGATADLAVMQWSSLASQVSQLSGYVLLMESD